MQLPDLPRPAHEYMHAALGSFLNSRRIRLFVDERYWRPNESTVDELVSDTEDPALLTITLNNHIYASRRLLGLPT